MVAKLPLFKSEDQTLMLLQSRWKSIIDPLLSTPYLNGLVIRDVELQIGTNAVNHLLGRVQQGWVITDVNGGAQIYRSKAFNDKALWLVSDAAVTINLWVY